MITFVFVPLLLCSILIIVNLDDGTKYHLFYRLQQLPFFELTSDDSSFNLVF